MDNISNLLGSMTARFGDVLPGVLGALVVLIIGFIVAGIVKRVAKGLLSKTSIDDKLSSKMGGSGFRLDSFIAKLLYYLVVIYTLIIVLDMLGVQNVLEPLQDMVSKFIGFLPNVIAAGIIGFAGYIIANIGSEATGFLSERLESFGGKVGLNSGSVNLSSLVKQLVFILIFIPILIVALDTLNMDAISQPATKMLGQFLDAIPQIIAAVILLGVFYIAGKYITSILSDLLSNLGVDKYANQLGAGDILGGTSVSKLIGNVIFFFIIFTGLIAAADKLGLEEVQTILRDIFDIGGKVFFGLIILLGGLLISNFAVKAVSNTSKWMGPVVRFAIMGIFLAFALHTMGIAESIVNLAFGLTLGAIAVAFALSFGLGGREAAGKQMEHFFNDMRNK
jgi:flagellar biosynthesis protein FliQ